MNSAGQSVSLPLTAPNLSHMAQAVLMIAYTYYETDPRVIRAAEAALEGGFSVDVIALRRPGQLSTEIIRGVRVYRVQARYRGSSLVRYVWEYMRFFTLCVLRSAWLFLSRRYKVVHVHNMPDALVFSAIVPKLFGAKVILDIHDPMPETYGSKFRNLGNNIVGRLLLLQERLSVAFANQTITVSQPVKNGILVKHGYHPETIGVVANFADDSIFTPLEYPSTDGLIRFVFHGTILERYGLRSLVEAVAKVRHRERIRVRIIGEGDFSSTLNDLIHNSGVGDVVEFVNRMYPLHEIPQMLSDCHVGLVPLDIRTSTVANYALPLKLVEYACLGLPSISIRNAAIEYYFQPDECMFFDSGDAASLAQRMLQVVEDPGILIRYRNGLTKVRERLLWSKEKEKYVSMLQGLAYGDELVSTNVRP
ncbi:MAG: glycosyltransferase family 4 protein [Nitrospira sp.]|nr:glycosyltransferase family 4 protein [Nitrospira sp.]